MKGFLIFLAVLMLVSNLSAQPNAVEITGGRIFVTRTPAAGNARIQTENFTATGTVGWSLTPFEISCQTETECRPGRTITVPGTAQLYFGETYFRGGNTFIINGTTYQNAYFEGESTLEQVSFSIPKTLAYRKKGTISLRKLFKYSTQMRVCQVSMTSAPCPAEKLLFDGNLIGEGTLILTLETRFSEVYGLYYRIKSYDYSFE